MTVSYQYEVASSTSGGFTRLLFMWRGSLYKLIYRELLLFLVAFGVLSALYRHTFNKDQKMLFEKVVIYCDTFINLIPLSFVLGFYVAYVAGRWWQQYMAIPWPDKVMHSLALYVNGNDEHARIVRRTLMRYLNLTLILVLRSISSAVKRRFPTLEHLVEAGFMTGIELEMYQSVPSVEFNTYWIPCTWFISLLKDARQTNRISDPQGLKIIMEEFNEFRSKCGLLWSYDWVSIPLVYTQVVTIATYSFFLAALVGRQFVEGMKKTFQMEIDIYVPVFTILQFLFFMGLLKVAEQLINPFGDDDEDFELNWLIDRHTKVSYLGVDILMARSPPLVKDKYFDDVDLTLPYTEASVAYKKKTYRGSVHNMTVPEEKHSMFLPEITEEDEERSSSTPKSSVVNLQSAAAAVVAPTAAGIWRARPASCQNLFRPNDTTEAAGTPTVEEGLGMGHPFASPRPDHSMTMPSQWTGGPVTYPVRRTESAPAGKKPTYPSIIQAWPSSSTLARSELSLHCSEVSIDTVGSPAHSCTSIGGWVSNLDTPRPQPIGKSLQWPKVETKPQSSVSNLEGVVENSVQNQQFKSSRRPRIKSCPKLVPIKKQNISLGNKKKGVRWKPLVSEGGGANGQRRCTVDVLPAVSPMFNSPTASPCREVPPLLCEGCRIRLATRQDSDGSVILDPFIAILDTVSSPNLAGLEASKLHNGRNQCSWHNRLGAGLLRKMRFGNKKCRRGSEDSEPSRNPSVSPSPAKDGTSQRSRRRFLSRSLPNMVLPFTPCSSACVIPTACSFTTTQHNSENSQLLVVPAEKKNYSGQREGSIVTLNSSYASAENSGEYNAPKTVTTASANNHNVEELNLSFQSETSWKSADWSTLLNNSSDADTNKTNKPSSSENLSNVPIHHSSDIEASKDDSLEEVIINLPAENHPTKKWELPRWSLKKEL